MKSLTVEWLAKAEEDFSVAVGLARRRKVPADSICFHCQQAAEKYLKAVLQEAGVAFGKTHDLEVLLQSAAAQHKLLGGLAGDCQRLNDYAVRYRYPGMDATVRQAKQAVKAIRTVRKSILDVLP